MAVLFFRRFCKTDFTPQITNTLASRKAGMSSCKSMSKISHFLWYLQYSHLASRVILAFKLDGLILNTWVLRYIFSTPKIL